MRLAPQFLVPRLRRLVIPLLLLFAFAALDSTAQENVTSSTTSTAEIYKGTADGFASALPGFVDRAAKLRQVPQNYAKEISYIAEAAHSCASIASYLAARRQDVRSGKIHPPFGGEYAICEVGSHNVTTEVRTYDHERERILVMTVAPWQDGKGITLQLKFGVLKSDDTSQRKLFASQSIVNASIDAPAEAPPPPQ
jgi:hypothetical protein